PSLLRAVHLPVVGVEERLSRIAEPGRVRDRAAAARAGELRDRRVVLLLGALARRRVGLARLVVERIPLHARVGGLDVALDHRRHVLTERLGDAVLAFPDGGVGRDGASVLGKGGGRRGGCGRRGGGRRRAVIVVADVAPGGTAAVAVGARR